MPNGIAIPAQFNLAEHCIGRGAAATPDKTALIVVSDPNSAAEAERWSYAQLDVMVRRVGAGLLASGLVAGDHIVLHLPNTSDYAILFFGAMAAGLVPIPVSAQLTRGELALLLGDSEARAVARAEPLEPGVVRPECRVLDGNGIAELKRADPLPGYAPTAAEDPAYMIYTSGTGKLPKGVVHAHRVALGRAPMHCDWEAIGADDVMLHAGAFNWSYTLGVGLLDPWSSGATAVLYSGPREVEVWPRLIRNTGATLFAAVPGLYRQMLKYCRLDRADFARVRHCLAAGEALSPSTLNAWQESTGTPLYEALGMSECSTFASSGPGVPTRPGSPGKPQAGRRVAVLPIEGGDAPLPPGETGLLAIHRTEPGLMLGYWRRPDEDAATSRGDWFVGGDLARFDADGYLWFEGRADDVMNAGGYRVSPLEVEAALAGCPGLAEVAVAEWRVRSDASVIAAFVVRQDGSALTPEAVLAHAEGRLAAYKRPKQVFFVDRLPRNPNGKLLRRQLSPGVPTP